MQGIDDISAALDELDQLGRRRASRTVEAHEGMRVRIDGRWLVSFASNDYLGLAASAATGDRLDGLDPATRLGAGASHLLGGHHAAHAALEAELATFIGLPRALLFGSGYMANLAVLTSLVGRAGEVFADRLNHASLVDAARLSQARHRRFRHNDLGHLASLLEASRVTEKIIVSDAVFSMDGDVANLSGLLELARRHNAWLYVDDAHGIGVLGAGGAGSLQAQEGMRAAFAGYPMAVYMATLGKALGVAGAFVAADARVIDWLVNKARTYVYTTAMAPLLAELARANLRRAATESWRRERVACHVRAFRSGMAGSVYNLMPSETPIQPIVAGEDGAAIRLAEALSEAGLYVPAIRPPTVPGGTARLRVSLSAGHAPEDVARLIEALRAHAKR
jgi:8-amino-7-oxononanoate synthase